MSELDDKALEIIENGRDAFGPPPGAKSRVKAAVLAAASAAAASAAASGAQAATGGEALPPEPSPTPQGPAPAATPGVTSAPVASSAAASGAKWVVATLAATGVATVFYAARAPEPPPPPDIVPTVVADAGARARRPLDAGRIAVPNNEPEVVPPASVAPERAKSTSPRPIRRRTPKASAAPDVTPDAGASAAPVAVDAGLPLKEPVAKKPTLNLEELKLLTQAQRALRNSGHQQALNLTDEHARRFPNSRFLIERRTIRALAWCGLSRADQARAEAKWVLENAPDSPSAQRLRDSCAVIRKQ